MKSRAEITRRYALRYVGAVRGVKGKILDEVVGVTGWSRDNARRRLRLAAKPGAPGLRGKRGRKPRVRKYSYDSLKVLQRVWSVMGGACGKYLASVMGEVLDNLQAHQKLVFGQDRYSTAVRQELLSMSAATIDRYLAPARAKDPLRGVSTTKPSTTLRSSITIRKAGDEVERDPGFFEADTVAHCGLGCFG